MSLKSPLGRVLGLGSARTGTEHWLGQRLSAVALVPLTLWFALALLALPALDFHAVNAWVATPLHAVLLVLLLVALIYHSSLGVQVVVEDYVHAPALRAVVLVLSRLIHVTLAVSGILAVVLIATRAPV